MQQSSSTILRAGNLRTNPSAKEDEMSRYDPRDWTGEILRKNLPGVQVLTDTKCANAINLCPVNELRLIRASNEHR